MDYLYQVSFDHDFLEIYWLIEFDSINSIRFLNNSSPPKKEMFFLSEDKKQAGVK